MLAPITRIRHPFYLYDSDLVRCIDSAWLFEVEADVENLGFKVNNQNRRWIRIEGIPLESSLDLPFTEYSADLF